MRRLSSYNPNNSIKAIRADSGIPAMNLPQNVARRFSAPRISLVDNKLMLGKSLSSAATSVSNSATMNEPTRAAESNNLNMSIRGIQAIHGNDVSEIYSDEENSSTDSIHIVDNFDSIHSNHDTLGKSDAPDTLGTSAAPEIPDVPNAHNALNTFDTTSRNIAKIGKEELEIINTSIDIYTAEENNITNDNPKLKCVDSSERPTSEDTTRVTEISTKPTMGQHSTKFKRDRSAESPKGKKLSSKTKNTNITIKSKSRKGRNTESGQPNSVDSITHDLSSLKLYESKPSHKSLIKLTNKANKNHENMDVYNSSDEDIYVKVMTRKPRSVIRRHFSKKWKMKSKATHIGSKKKHNSKS